MFGRKEDTLPIPVVTVETLSKPYEPITTVEVKAAFVSTEKSRQKMVLEIAKKGASLGADAVIGVTFQKPFGAVTYLTGTAVKYKTP